MKPTRIDVILDQVKSGEMEIDQAAAEMRSLTFEDMGFARIDHHRAKRCGYPEVIFCQGKRPEDVAKIAQSILGAGGDLLATRAEPAHFDAVKAAVPDAVYEERARTITHKQHHTPRPPRPIAIVAAGTSDVPVAEEARVTAEMMDNDVVTLYDVGVAGLHRLLASHQALAEAGVVIAVAGMEGALPSVVGGLVACPVIAVPTSVGYGASFNGLAPLLTMLNSCAAGVTVVNIDNGFGAAYTAALINRMSLRHD